MSIGVLLGKYLKEAIQGEPVKDKDETLQALGEVPKK